jgi:transposase
MSYFDVLYRKYDRVAISINEVAHELGVSASTINRMIAANEFDVAYVTRGHKRMYLLKSFTEFLEAYEELVA